ncbi:MAG: IS66 family transposase, partial [Phycisphaerales bacterium]|nr:IS66 family transposase [Phycisphaerales bacterium]
MLTLEQQRELQNRNAELEHRLKTSERQLSERDREIAEKQHRIEKLKCEIAELKRKLFGGKQGESVSDEQLQLALAELEAERQEQQLSEKEVAGYTRKKKKGEPKPRIPDHLEEVEELVIPEEVQADPEAWECIGEEVTEELDIEPTRFIKRRIIRPKYVRKGEADRKPVVAQLPPRVIPGGIPSAALMAFLIVSKYADHLPLYRLEKILGQRYRVPIRRQRMCDWIAYVVDNWLSLIYHSIRQGLMKGDYLQVDETPIRYLDNERKGKSHKGYFWVFGNPEGNVCFDWKLGRGRAAAESVLADFSGSLLQSDGYSVYDSMTRGSGVTQLGCWAHAR